MRYYPKPDTLEQINLQQDNVIEASAGTGKTFLLEHLVVELLLGEHRPVKEPSATKSGRSTVPLTLRELLLVTYTEKATAEMRQRIRSKLEDILAQASEVPPDAPHWVIDERAEALLTKALLDFESVSVYTIHGFCQRVLREYAFDSGQMFQQDHVSDTLTFPQVFGRWLRGQAHSRHARLLGWVLNNSTLKQIESQLQELLRQQAEILPQWVPLAQLCPTIQPQLLAVERAIKQLQQVASSPSSHVEAIFQRLALNGTKFREPAKQSILQGLFRLLEQWDSSQPALQAVLLFGVPEKTTELQFRKPKNKNEFATLEETPEEFSFFLNSVIEIRQIMRAAESTWMLALLEELTGNVFSADQAQHMFSSMRRTNAAYDKMARILLLIKVLPELKSALEQHKQQEGIFDFDDLLRLVHENLLPSPEAKSYRSEALLKALRQKYAVALIDEFQDTDPVQWDIFRQLFAASPHHRLMVIGDPKQAIYGFRGADVHTYLNAKKFIANANQSDPVSLNRNFRSSPQMIQAVNLVFEHESLFAEQITFKPVECGNTQPRCQAQPHRKALHLFVLPECFRVSWSVLQGLRNSLAEVPETEFGGWKPLEALAGKVIGWKEFEEKVVSPLQAVLDDKEYANLKKNCEYWKAPTVKQAIAEAYALEIKQLLDDAQQALQVKQGDQFRPLRPREICVLFRSKAEGLLLADHLKQHRVPFAFYKLQGLFTTLEAQQFYDLLRAIERPNERPLVYKALLTDFFNATLTELQQLRDQRQWPEAAWKLQHWHQQLFRQPPTLWFDSLLDESGLVANELFLSGDERRITNFRQLAEYLGSTMEAKRLDLRELLHHLKELMEGETSSEKDGDMLKLETDRQAVQLMTLHASKGLEFKVVFVFGGYTSGNNRNPLFYTFHQGFQRTLDLAMEDNHKELHQQELNEENQRLFYVGFTRSQARLYTCVPAISSQSGKSVFEFNGDYGVMVPALASLHQALRQGDNTDLKDCISCSDIEVGAHSQSGSVLSSLDQAQQVEVEQWLNQIKEKPLAPLWDLNAIYQQAKPFTISSYSRIHRLLEQRQQGAQTTEITLLEADTPSKTEKEETDTTASALLSEALPGGSKTGSMLHEMLEFCDLQVLQQVEDLQQWQELPEVKAMLLNLLRKYALEECWFETCADMVFNAWKVPLRDHPQVDLSLPLSHCEKVLREMDFYFPIPESFHPRLEQLSEDQDVSFDIERGFLNGSVDLICEHQGKVYFFDWKSNVLDDFHPDAIAKVVEEKYVIQYQIYTLAVLKWLRIHQAQDYEQRFGGFGYIFLRAYDGHLGSFLHRPSFEEVKQFEAELINLTYQ